jgi:hypothetical protein
MAKLADAGDLKSLGIQGLRSPDHALPPIHDKNSPGMSPTHVADIISGPV